MTISISNKFSLLLLLPILAVNAHLDTPVNVHARNIHARQAPASPSPSFPGTSTASPASSVAGAPAATSAVSSVAGPAAPAGPGGSASGIPGVATGTALPAATLTATDPAIPPLSEITSGMPSMATAPLPTTAVLGQPGPFPNFPPLPSTTLAQSSYPVPTGTIVAFETPRVQEWLKELEGHNIPDIPPNKPAEGNQGLCQVNPEAQADTSRCWWTCGGCTRNTDVVTCPDKQTWGLTFDDGPSPNTPRLLDYLEAQHLKSTFAVVGGSNYYFSDVLRAEYISGHHIIVHTYRHPPMTTLTTPEVVAELGYTREIIKDTIGVTPAYWRPPYGDVDDRVRAIAFAMGMETIIWTRNPTTLEQFDTNDWHIPAGLVTGPQAFTQFESILANATTLNTGFIVLEHDLYPETVDLAVGYTLPAAINHNPKFNIIPVIDCIKLPASEAYIETMTNKTRTPPATTWTGSFIKDPTTLLDPNTTAASGGATQSGADNSGNGASGGAAGANGQSNGKNAASSVTYSVAALTGAVVAVVMGLL